MPYEDEKDFELPYQTLQQSLGTLTPEVIGSAAYRMRQPNIGPATPELRVPRDTPSKAMWELPQADLTIEDFVEWVKGSPRVDKLMETMATIGPDVVVPGSVAIAKFAPILGKAAAQKLVGIFASKGIPLFAGTFKGLVSLIERAGEDRAVFQKLNSALQSGKISTYLASGAYGDAYRMKRYPDWVVKMSKGMGLNEADTVSMMEPDFSENPTFRRLFPEYPAANQDVAMMTYMPHYQWESIRSDMTGPQFNKLFLDFVDQFESGVEGFAKQGYYNADLHTGNFAIGPGGKPQLYDLGIIHSENINRWAQSKRDMLRKATEWMSRDLGMNLTPDLIERLANDYRAGLFTVDMLRDGLMLKKYSRDGINGLVDSGPSVRPGQDLGPEFTAPPPGEPEWSRRHPYYQTPANRVPSAPPTPSPPSTPLRTSVDLTGLGLVDLHPGIPATSLQALEPELRRMVIEFKKQLQHNKVMFPQDPSDFGDWFRKNRLHIDTSRGKIDWSMRPPNTAANTSKFDMNLPRARADQEWAWQQRNQQLNGIAAAIDQQGAVTLPSAPSQGPSPQHTGELFPRQPSSSPVNAVFTPPIMRELKEADPLFSLTPPDLNYQQALPGRLGSHGLEQTFVQLPHQGMQDWQLQDLLKWGPRRYWGHHYVPVEGGPSLFEMGLTNSEVFRQHLQGRDLDELVQEAVDQYMKPGGQ